MVKFEGLALVDKPAGITSHDLVDRARKIFGTRRVGHAGTLDPAASGLMILLIERGTRLSDYLLTGEKTYEVAIHLGYVSETFDKDAKELRPTGAQLPPESKIKEVCMSLQGDLELEVPSYSATKVDGKKLYEYAREGHEVPVVKKTMAFKVMSEIHVDQDLVHVTLKCSKGSFIRSWANKLGTELGCGAVVDKLRRLESAPFDITQALKIDELEQALKELRPSKTRRGLVAMEDSLPMAPAIKLTGFETKLMLSGQIPEQIQIKANSVYREAKNLRILDLSGQLISILNRSDSGGFKVGCVFPPNA